MQGPTNSPARLALQAVVAVLLSAAAGLFVLHILVDVTLAGRVALKGRSISFADSPLEFTLRWAFVCSLGLMVSLMSILGALGAAQQLFANSKMARFVAPMPRTLGKWLLGAYLALFAVWFGLMWILVIAFP